MTLLRRIEGKLYIFKQKMDILSKNMRESRLDFK